eukprot:7685567-Karenia_brevis.AAC.1
MKDANTSPHGGLDFPQSSWAFPTLCAKCGNRADNFGPKHGLDAMLGSNCWRLEKDWEWGLGWGDFLWEELVPWSFLESVRALEA